MIVRRKRLETGRIRLTIDHGSPQPSARNPQAATRNELAAARYPQRAGRSELAVVRSVSRQDLEKRAQNAVGVTFCARD
jgi:hypothetical protein